ncbi:MAG: PaaI family thioesterase [Jiangellales bacterium]
MSDVTPTPEQILAAIPPSALDQRMGIEVLEATRERVVARMPVAGNTQPFGLLHGGASCVLAESVGSIAANIHGAPTHYAVGTEISCSHHSGARSGYVTATATALKAGRQLATYHVAIVDDEGSPVATARLSCLLRPMPGGGDSGPAARR